MVAAAALFFGMREVNHIPSTDSAAPAGTRPSSQVRQESVYRRFSAREITGAHKAYAFSAEIPSGWQVEAVGPTEAINLYDPQASGSTNLEKSQIFITSAWIS